MEIIFRTRQIRDLCNDPRKAVRTLGTAGAKKLQARLDDLYEAANLGVMRTLPGHCKELRGDRAGQLSLRLDGPFRLLFVPEHEPLPLKPDGGLDWNEVTAVCILGIEDYHDG